MKSAAFSTSSSASTHPHMLANALLALDLNVEPRIPPQHRMWKLLFQYVVHHTTAGGVVSAGLSLKGQVVMVTTLFVSEPQ